MKRIEKGIDHYLNRFEDSPYVRQGQERQVVEGISTLRGSWQEPPKKSGD